MPSRSGISVSRPSGPGGMERAPENAAAFIAAMPPSFRAFAFGSFEAGCDEKGMYSTTRWRTSGNEPVPSVSFRSNPIRSHLRCFSTEVQRDVATPPCSKQGAWRSTPDHELPMDRDRGGDGPLAGMEGSSRKGRPPAALPGLVSVRPAFRIDVTFHRLKWSALRHEDASPGSLALHGPGRQIGRAH